MSHTHNKRKYSFVFVSDHPNPNEIKAEISWAPTLQEAFDIIEIEEIQRDLEF